MLESPTSSFLSKGFASPSLFKTTPLNWARLVASLTASSARSLQLCVDPKDWISLTLAVSSFLALAICSSTLTWEVSTFGFSFAFSIVFSLVMTSIVSLRLSWSVKVSYLLRPTPTVVSAGTETIDASNGFQLTR